MTEIFRDISLKPFNTFGVEIKAKYLCYYRQPSDLKYLITEGPLTRDEKMVILGGGSNQLFTGDFEGVIIHPVNDEISIVKENDDFVWIKAGAGLEWDKLVEYTVDKGWGGLENLSNIPGSVGAAPVQNIGAYGVEVKDTLDQVHLVGFDNGSEKTLTNEECQFGYRNSIFKHRLKNRYLVDSATFKLSKKPHFVIHYGTIKEELDKLGEINLKNIREAVIRIRNSKLPDPKITGNGGSFFKNPVIPEIEAKFILEKYPEIPVYDAEPGMKKLAAGYLIDKCGLKGYTNLNKTAGVHELQALVIVNKGGATGHEILEVARTVQKKVFEEFDVNLEPEVIIL